MSRRRWLRLAGVGAGLGAGAAMPLLANGSVRLADGAQFALPPQVSVTERVVNIGEVSLWCWDTGGDGEPLVLLHPATGSGHIWGYQQPFFAAQGYRVIGYSRRGHNGSSAGPQDDPGTGADDLHRLVDKIGLERFHLLGTAAGGFIAPDFAASWPDRLISMTIACSMGGGVDPAYREAFGRLLTDEFRAMPATFRELGPSYRAAHPEGVAAWHALEEASAPQGRIRQVPRNTLDWATIGRIATPTLVIAGGADLYSPPAVMLEYARHLPDCRSVIIAESGHSAYWENPDRFNAAVLEHLQSHPAAPRS